MKQFLWSFFFCSIVVFNLQSICCGQDGGQQDTLNDAALNLLFGNKKIQSQIQLTRSQLTELRKIEETMLQETRPLQERLRKSTVALRSDGSDDDQLEEQSAEMKQVQEELALKRTEFQTQIDDVLLPHQVKWLRQAATQIRLRRTTPQNQSVLMSEHLVGALEITTDQIKEMQEIAKESQQDLDEIVAKHRQETRDDLLKVLTQEQRDAFDEIFGKKFDF